TRLQRLPWKRAKVDSSLHSTFAQSSLVQLAWSRHHARRAALFAALTSGFFRARQFLSPIERSTRPTVRAETRLFVFFRQIVCTPSVHSRRFWLFLRVTNHFSCMRSFCLRRGGLPERALELKLPVSA